VNGFKAVYAVAVTVFLCVFFADLDSSCAHRVNVFAWVEGDTVFVEGRFSGGKMVKSGEVVVMDSQGERLVTGQTNDQGEFSFKIPKRTDLRILLIAGQGHQGEWNIHAAEMENLPLTKTSQESVANTKQSQQRKAISQPSVNTRIPALQTPFNPDELEAVIETVLDRKLRPISRTLADMRQGGPSVQDIFSGIGYILGLVGIAAYIQSRKNRE
jgi:nickel transport protein